MSAEKLSPKNNQPDVLQEEVSSLLAPPVAVKEKSFQFVLSDHELTPQEIKEKMSFQVDGQKGNVPDFLKEHLPNLLTDDERDKLHLDGQKSLTPEKTLATVKHLLEKGAPDQTIIGKVETILPTGKKLTYAAFVASLQVVGIEAIQEIHRQNEILKKQAVVPQDKTFGQGSRRKLWSGTFEGLGDELLLEGKPFCALDSKKLTQSEAERNLRVAQALFNALLPPEQLIKVARLKQSVKQEEDRVKKHQYARQLTSLRQRLYQSILKAFNVKTEKGEIAINEKERPEVETIAKQVQERRGLIEGMNLQQANRWGLEQVLMALKQTDDSEDNEPLRQTILKEKAHTNKRLTKKQDLSFATLLSCGLNGIEFFYRRSLGKTKEEIAPEEAKDGLPDWLNPKISLLKIEQSAHKEILSPFISSEILSKSAATLIPLGVKTHQQFDEEIWSKNKKALSSIVNGKKKTFAYHVKEHVQGTIDPIDLIFDELETGNDPFQMKPEIQKWNAQNPNDQLKTNDDARWVLKLACALHDVGNLTKDKKLNRDGKIIYSDRYEVDQAEIRSALIAEQMIDHLRQKNKSLETSRELRKIKRLVKHLILQTIVDFNHLSPEQPFWRLMQTIDQVGQYYFSKADVNKSLAGFLNEYKARGDQPPVKTFADLFTFVDKRLKTLYPDERQRQAVVSFFEHKGTNRPDFAKLLQQLDGDGARPVNYETDIPLLLDGKKPKASRTELKKEETVNEQGKEETIKLKYKVEALLKKKSLTTLALLLDEPNLIPAFTEWAKNYGAEIIAVLEKRMDFIEETLKTDVLKLTNAGDQEMNTALKNEMAYLFSRLSIFKKNQAKLTEFLKNHPHLIEVFQSVLDYDLSRVDADLKKKLDDAQKIIRNLGDNLGMPFKEKAVAPKQTEPKIIYPRPTFRWEEVPEEKLTEKPPIEIKCEAVEKRSGYFEDEDEYRRTQRDETSLAPLPLETKTPKELAELAREKTRELAERIHAQSNLHTTSQVVFDAEEAKKKAS